MKFTPLNSPQPGSVVVVPQYDGDSELTNAMLQLQSRGGAISVHPAGQAPVTRSWTRPIQDKDTLPTPGGPIDPSVVVAPADSEDQYRRDKEQWDKEQENWK